jgi:uncharacterized LabA/DUF88 family protein
MSVDSLKRVVLFIDEKNVYWGARRAFFDKSAHHTCGQFNPMRLGQLICSRLPRGVSEGRALSQVRLYTGTPSATFEPKSYGAHMKQRSAWEAAGVIVISRPLRYLANRSPGEQKGIDVALAVDFVTLAVEGHYDVGIIFSTDTDLKPALEFVAGRDGPKAEVACWWSPSAQSYLSIRGGPPIWSWRLMMDHYKAVADYTDYNKSSLAR